MAPESVQTLKHDASFCRRNLTGTKRTHARVHIQTYTYTLHTPFHHLRRLNCGSGQQTVPSIVCSNAPGHAPHSLWISVCMQGTHARMSCVCVCMCVCVSVCERVRLCVARRSTYAICALVISTHCLICKIRNDVCAILVLFIKVIGPRHELGPLVYTGTHKYTHKYTYTNTHINTSLSLNWTALEHRGTQRTFISDKLTPQSGLITSILACYDRMNLEAYIASIFHTSKYLYVDANFAGKVGKSTLPFLCHPAGGCRKHNFWTARVKSIKNYIFGILTLSVTWVYVPNNIEN